MAEDNGKMEKVQEGKKRGYLFEKFRFFHIRDQVTLDIQPHYHEFDKLIILLSGKVTYIIEGKFYELLPWDILLVGRHDIHKPLIHTGQPYERFVIFFREDFMECGEERLSECFRITHKKQLQLLRPRQGMLGRLKELLAATEEEISFAGFGSRTMAEGYMKQLLVLLGRLAMEGTAEKPDGIYTCDKQIEELLTYINENIAEELSVDMLAGSFYMSSSYLMHKFKKETGYSIHRYIRTKRLMLAAELLKEGASAAEAGLKCGFKEYSAFSRAFYQMYGVTPGKFAGK